MKIGRVSANNSDRGAAEQEAAIAEPSWNVARSLIGWLLMVDYIAFPLQPADVLELRI